MKLKAAYLQAHAAVRAELGPELPDASDLARCERRVTVTLLAHVLACWPQDHDGLCGMLLDLAAADRRKAGAA